MIFAIVSVLPAFEVAEQGDITGPGIPWMHAALCAMALLSAICYLRERRRVLNTRHRKPPRAEYSMRSYFFRGDF